MKSSDGRELRRAERDVMVSHKPWHGDPRERKREKERKRAEKSKSLGICGCGSGYEEGAEQGSLGLKKSRGAGITNAELLSIIWRMIYPKRTFVCACWVTTKGQRSWARRNRGHPWRGDGLLMGERVTVMR